jgi:hypothetical protein
MCASREAEQSIRATLLRQPYRRPFPWSETATPRPVAGRERSPQARAVDDVRLRVHAVAWTVPSGRRLTTAPVERLLNGENSMAIEHPGGSTLQRARATDRRDSVAGVSRSRRPLGQQAD